MPTIQSLAKELYGQAIEFPSLESVHTSGKQLRTLGGLYWIFTRLSVAQLQKVGSHPLGGRPIDIGLMARLYGDLPHSIKEPFVTDQSWLCVYNGCDRPECTNPYPLKKRSRDHQNGNKSTGSLAIARHNNDLVRNPENWKVRLITTDRISELQKTQATPFKLEQIEQAWRLVFGWPIASRY